MIALWLGAILSITVIKLFNGLNHLNQREKALFAIEERMQFITLFLREKIQENGNWNCLLKKPDKLPILRVLDFSAALEQGIHIKRGSNVLQLQECVRFHHKEQYLPLEFFIAKTTRFNAQHTAIYALFMKISTYEREELTSGVTEFTVGLAANLVRINYVLSSIDNILNKSASYWFDNKRVYPIDKIFYQPLILNVSVRNE